MEPWTIDNVTNLAGIYTILFCMVGVCYLMCEPIGGTKQPAKRAPEVDELASAQAQARAQAQAQEAK
ncbi:hypothetical protein SEUCBS139899_006619 [Sporothrix eucalyptigena]|uniref:Uncharacterized protein n=1 Tax=Sporothrix eucalyptigena TaxID=1812306 RepID=A0ABP0B311_9PEZI